MREGGPKFPGDGRCRASIKVAGLTLGLTLTMSACSHYAAETSAKAPRVMPLPALGISNLDYQTDRRQLMGTVFEVRLRAEPSAKSGAAIDACFRIFDHVDQTMSEWKAGSPLSLVSQRAGIAAVPVPADLFTVLEAALGISKASNGAFDPTWAALWGLWRFDRAPEVPSSLAITERLALVDWQAVELDRPANTVFLRHGGMVLGLGGIAKGHALAQAASELRRRGFMNFLLYAGGQVYAAGSKVDGPWKIGVQDPCGEAGDFFASLAVQNESVSTSGDYEHYFVIDGVRYHHIIDPRTGYPANGIRSATVIATEATVADAYSTALVVLGSEEGLALAKRIGFEALIIQDDGTLAMTDGMRSRLTVLREPRARKVK